MVIQSYGTYLPVILPAGYSIQVLQTYGYWSLNEIGAQFTNTGEGDPIIMDGDFARGRMVIKPVELDNTINPFVDAFGIYNAETDHYICFLENPNLGDIFQGQLLATIQITNGTAIWEQTFDFRQGNPFGWLIDVGTGIDTARGFYSSITTGSDQTELIIRYPATAADYHVTGVYVTMQSVYTDAETFVSLVIADGNTISSTDVTYEYANMPSAADTTRNPAIDHTFADGFIIHMTAAPITTPGFPEAQISKVIIQGTGANPFH
jgi:hypothetical protein